MPEIQSIMFFWGEEKSDTGYCILSLIFANFSLNSSHCFFKLSRKRKEKAFFSQRKHCSFWTDMVILHVRKTYRLQAAETDRRSPPAMGMRTQRQGFSSARPETESNSPSCLRATSPGCLQSKSNHIWLQAKFRKLDYLSPPIRWEMAGWGEREGRSEKLTQALKMLWNCNMHL